MKDRESDFDFLEFGSEKKTSFSKQMRPEKVENLFKVEKHRLGGNIPNPRNDHRVVAKSNKVFLIGGTTENQNSFTAYVLDLEKSVWKETRFFDKLEEKKPISGMAGIATWPENLYPHLKGFALMYGGWTGKEYSDCLYLINLETTEIKSLRRQSHYTSHEAKQLKPKQSVSIGNSKEIEKYQASQNPPPRKDASFCYVTSENKMYMYGGWDGKFNTGSKDQLWVLSSTWKWEKYLGTSRRGHTSIVVDNSKNGGASGFYVFGGFKGIKVASNEVVFYDTKLKKWSNIEFGEEDLLPAGRAYHTANLIDSKMIIIGGLDDQFKILEDVWIYDINEKSWSKFSLPIKDRSLIRRAGHSSFVLNSKIYLLGGMTYLPDKRQYLRVSLEQIVVLDFTHLISKKQPSQLRFKDIKINNSLNIKHNMEHHWDVTEFGFPLKKEEDQMKELYADLEGLGITDNEMIA